MYPGADDLRRAADRVALELPAPLAPLARLAYNYRWSWAPGGPDAFEAVDPHRWRLMGHNPVELLTGTLRSTLEWAAVRPGFAERVAELAALVDADLARPPPDGPIGADHPVAFLCAEFGVHSSLPIYSGGLGVLAGDVLKEASDLGLPMVGVGLLYSTGYFHQRIDATGLQQEYWIEIDAERLPAARVHASDGTPLRVTLPLGGEQVVVQVWRVDVGRVPLYLLDTNVPENSAIGRWITSRLYEGLRPIRLAQYAVLGVGGVRALRAMGIEPAVYHLNEGHPALGTLQLARWHRDDGGGGVADASAWDAVRSQVVFTTHTPVPAGNETYTAEEIERVLGGLAEELGGGLDHLLRLGRVDPNEPSAASGMTPLAIRAARSTNGVSARHGEVARAMWQPLFPVARAEDVPITSVTNGVHVPTWLCPPMRDLLDRHLGEGWTSRADEDATWAPVADIPAAELWAARGEARRQMFERLGPKIVTGHLRRGDPLEFAQRAERMMSPDVLTFGFARRIASYKRLHLLARTGERGIRLFEGEHPVQLLVAGKAHPRDDDAKRIVQRLFTMRQMRGVVGHAAFLDDYDMALATSLVAGCDVWINLPRPPQEASGTSGMKSALNGGLNLSVLDGWWCEAFDGTNGWAIDGAVDGDEAAQDRRHADELYERLQASIAAFYDRDAEGIPRRWVEMIRRSLVTVGPRFSARRMMREYAERVYRPV